MQDWVKVDMTKRDSGKTVNKYGLRSGAFLHVQDT